MKPVNNKIVIRVDPLQKDTMEIAGVRISTANKYETNYRYKSPTVAEVVVGNDTVRKGDILLIHHNLCYLPSPYHLQDDLFSVPFSKVLFAKVTVGGDIIPICGNTICREVPVETFLPVPGDEKKNYLTVYEMVDPGWTNLKKGDIVFTRPSSGYTIVYNWQGVEKKVLKVDSDMICGFFREKS